MVFECFAPWRRKTLEKEFAEALSGKHTTC